MDRILNSFKATFHVFLSYVPEILGAAICFTITFLAAKFLSGIASRFTLRRTKDSLISSFIGKILWTIIFIAGAVIALGILGLGTVSNKILAGAGITTFIIGFALKDIGENFLAGVILAFSRPYREGSLIECEGIKGVVRSMSMRQTTVEVENGRIVLIPNSSIIKEPLTKYLESDLDMRQEFSISVEVRKARKAVEIIQQAVASFEYVMNTENKPVKVIVDSFTDERAKLTVVFWFDTKKFEGSRSGTKSEIMLEVCDRLEKENIKFSG